MQSGVRQLLLKQELSVGACLSSIPAWAGKMPDPHKPAFSSEYPAARLLLARAESQQKSAESAMHAGPLA